MCPRCKRPRALALVPRSASEPAYSCGGLLAGLPELLPWFEICPTRRRGHLPPGPLLFEQPSAPLPDLPLGQSLPLLCSYEEASPRVKQRASAARAAAAPWRAIMRDQNDDMIFSMRGLPEQVGMPCCLLLPAAALAGLSAAITLPCASASAGGTRLVGSVVLHQCPAAVPGEAAA